MKKIINTKIKFLIIFLIMIVALNSSVYASEDYTIVSGKITKYNGTASEVTIPETIDGQAITGIEKDAFYGNTTITKVVIPGSIKTIGEQAFFACENLRTVELQEGIQVIGKFAFQYCVSLTEIVFPGSVTDIASGALAKSSNLTKITVKEGVEKIGSGAFSNLLSLTTVELPESITSIQSDAFSGSNSNFTIKAPQYKSNTTTISETAISKLAKTLVNDIGITYSPTNYAVFINQPAGGKITTTKIVVNAGETIDVNLEISPEYEKESFKYITEDGTETEITGNQITTPASNIEITATLSIIQHNITATAGQNGTIEPSGITPVIQTKNQEYKITPKTGYAIDKLKIDDQEITPQTTYTFTNVTEAHTIEVTFRQLGTNTLETTISNILKTTTQVQEQTPVTITSGTSTNFTSWTTSGIQEQNTKNINFNMPNNEVKITYNYKEPNYNTTTLESTTSTINQTQLQETIEITEGDTIKLEIEESEENKAQVTISKTNIEQIVEKQNINQLQIETEIGTLTIQKEALETIAEKANGSEIEITIKEQDPNNLTEDQKNQVGNRPVYQFQIKSNETPITEFNGNIIVTLPYTLKSGENSNGITIYYIDENGNTEEMRTIYNNGTVSFTTTHFSEYYIKNIIEEQEKQQEEQEKQEQENQEQEKQEENKEQITTTKKKKKKKTNTEKVEQEKQEEQHPENKEETEEIKLNFSDIKEDGWYIDAIKYAVKNNIAKGTSETTFSPSSPIKRGDAITMICRAYKIEEETDRENFIDTGNTYYTGYIQALKNKKLLSGVGENKVEPKREITRQEILVLLYNIQKYQNKIEETEQETQNEKNKTNYTDYNEISSWAKNAVEYFIKTKIIVGENGKLNPKRNITRAETVQILYNLKTREQNKNIYE